MKGGGVIDKLGYVAAIGVAGFALNSGPSASNAPPNWGSKSDIGSGGAGGGSYAGATDESSGGDPNNPNGDVPYEGDGSFDSQHAIDFANGDNAGAGYCARGVANITEAQGLGNFRGINANQFPDRMASQGWVRLEGATPQNAPVGSILTFGDSGGRSGGGAQYGHVEIVGQTSSGSRTYISDAARSNSGGTVPQNFSGVWVRQ